MSYNYTEYVTALSNLTAIPSDDTSFTGIIPRCIEYAEQRIYRELNLISTVVRDSSASLTPGSRNFTLPTSQGTFVVVNGINAISPAGSSPTEGIRNPLTPISLPTLDMIWPSSTGTGLPKYFAMVTQTAVVVGPWPDDSYVMEVIGTQRPTALAAGNPTTFLTTYLPDLFLAASMIFMSGFMRDYGQQSDDPRMAQSWESQYGALLASANGEELRKMFMGSAWSSLTQGPAAPARN